MQRHSNTQISSLIVLLSIITILVQFVTYYFLANVLMIWGMSCLISFLCCHILLEKSATYDSCFIYSILTLFISITITFLTYGKESQLLLYSNMLIGIIVINWIIPMVHCFLRHMLDYGSRVENFTTFYRNSNLVFFLCYITLSIYVCFIQGAFPWMYRLVPEKFSFIPFWTLAAYIEDVLYDTIALNHLITHIVTRIILYIPFGFYCGLLLRNSMKVVRFILILLLPIVIELSQFYFISSRYDMDDIIYGFLGGMIGLLLYWVINLIYYSISGRDFLSNDREYRFSNQSLHF